MEVTKLRDLAEEEQQKLIAEQLRLTAQIGTLHERLDSAKSLNRSHETKIIEQQSRIDELLVEHKQVSGW